VNVFREWPVFDKTDKRADLVLDTYNPGSLPKHVIEIKCESMFQGVSAFYNGMVKDFAKIEGNKIKPEYPDPYKWVIGFTCTAEGRKAMLNFPEKKPPIKSTTIQATKDYILIIWSYCIHVSSTDLEGGICGKVANITLIDTTQNE
jgi:hypothetical protein